MLIKEPGIESGSDMYFNTVSENAKRLLYYVYACGSFFVNSKYHVKREDYNNYLLVYVKNGHLSISCQNKSAVVKEGQIGILDCHIPHEYRAIVQCEFVWFHFDGPFMDEIYRELIRIKGGIAFDCKNADEIEAQIMRFIYKARTRQGFNEYDRSLRIYRLLLSLLNESFMGDSEEQEISDPVARTMEFIEQNFKRDISVPEMAEQVSLSKFHFTRMFKRECGFSPHEYLMMTRFDRAMYLLKTTDCSIKDIAESVGYHNVSTFSTAFSDRVGISPSQFRNMPV